MQQKSVRFRVMPQASHYIFSLSLCLNETDSYDARRRMILTYFYSWCVSIEQKKKSKDLASARSLRFHCDCGLMCRNKVDSIFTPIFLVEYIFVWNLW